MSVRLPLEAIRTALLCLRLRRPFSQGEQICSGLNSSCEIACDSYKYPASPSSDFAMPNQGRFSGGRQSFPPCFRRTRAEHLCAFFGEAMNALDNLKRRPRAGGFVSPPRCPRRRRKEGHQTEAVHLRSSRVSLCGRVPASALPRASAASFTAPALLPSDASTIYAICQSYAS